MEDEKIIELFFERSENALVQTREKYYKLCCKIAENILGNFEDGEECANEALLGAWNSIPPARPANFKAYICKIARNRALKMLSYNTAEKRSSACAVSLSELEEIIPDQRINPEYDSGELAAALNRFLGTLRPDARNVFMRKYWYFDTVKEITERYSFSESKVNNLLYRTRQKLRAFLKKEGIEI